MIDATGGTSAGDDIPAWRQDEIRCPASGPNDGDPLCRAGGLAFARPVLAHRSGFRRRELDQVLAGEARVAEAARLRLGSLVHPFAREIPERVGGDVPGDLLLGVRGGDQLAAHRRVDAVVAGPAGGGALMRRCTSRAPASRIILTIFRDVVPRTMESSTTMTRLPRTTAGTGLSLSFTPKWRMDCEGSMKVRPT